MGIASQVIKFVPMSDDAMSIHGVSIAVLASIFATNWSLLGTLALKVVSMASSSASNARTVSTMELIDSKLRNRLCRDTVEKLIYVKAHNLQCMKGFNRAIYDDYDDDDEIDVADDGVVCDRCEIR